MIHIAEKLIKNRVGMWKVGLWMILYPYFLVCRPALNPLSHSSQGYILIFQT